MLETRFEPQKISMYKNGLNLGNNGKIFVIGVYNIMFICSSHDITNLSNYIIKELEIDITNRLTNTSYPINIENIIRDSFIKINELIRCNYYTEYNTLTSCTLCIIDDLTIYFGILGNIKGTILRKEHNSYHKIFETPLHTLENEDEKKRILNMDINIHLLEENTISGGFGGMEISYLEKKPLIIKYNLKLNDIIILSLNSINLIESYTTNYYNYNKPRNTSLAKYLSNDNNDLILTCLI
jgi:hypothetical protein